MKGEVADNGGMVIGINISNISVLFPVKPHFLNRVGFDKNSDKMAVVVEKLIQRNTCICR